MDYCYHEAARRNPDALAFGEIGPRLLTAAVEKFSLQGHVVSPETFCPIYAWQWRQLIHAGFVSGRKWSRALSSAYAVHLYHEMWRRNGIDKDGSFPEASIYEQLKRRYLNGGRSHP